MSYIALFVAFFSFIIFLAALYFWYNNSGTPLGTGAAFLAFIFFLIMFIAIGYAIYTAMSDNTPTVGTTPVVIRMGDQGTCCR